MSKILIVLTFFIFIFGTFGNLICFFVFSRKKFQKISVTFFFKAISINNCIILLHELRHYVDTAFSYNIKLISEISCKITLYLVYSTMSISAWIMVYIIIERYISIQFFKKFKFLCYFKFKCMILSLIYFLSFGIYLPVGINGRLRSIDSNETSINKICDFNNNKNLITLIDLIYFELIPFILMIIFTSLTIFVIFQSRIRFKNQIGHTNRLKKDIYFALTSIIVNFVFLATNLTVTIHDLISYDLNIFIISLNYLQCAISFFIHMFTNKIFYKEFLVFIGVKNR